MADSARRPLDAFRKAVVPHVSLDGTTSLLEVYREVGMQRVDFQSGFTPVGDAGAAAS